MNTDPPVYPEINLHNVGGKDIIEVKIKESEKKPVFFKTHAFKRVSKTNQRISTSEIRTLAREERIRLSFDELICKEASLEDIDEVKVRAFLTPAKQVPIRNCPQSNLKRNPQTFFAFSALLSPLPSRLPPSLVPSPLLALLLPRPLVFLEEQVLFLPLHSLPAYFSPL